MRTRQRPRLSPLYLVGLLVLGGCGGQTTAPPDLGATCVRGPIRAVLHVDATDSRLIWATDLATSRDHPVKPRSELRWGLDPGPPTRLLDGAGRVAGRDGDILSSACVESISGTFFIGPEDLPPPDRPPN